MPEIGLEIVKVGDLLAENLSIPSYQRPYRWTTQSVLTLFNDVINAMNNGIKEYRIGSVVLYMHKDTKGNEVYDIVDGQQRLTSLSIIDYCLSNDSNSSLLNKEYNELSYKAICENYEVINRRILDLYDNDKKDFSNYLRDKCTMVKIVTNTEQEAFQFFDSQNTRGKSLEPHDLLKSYHLREMVDIPEEDKTNIISKWEDTNQEALSYLFRNNLYPIIQWSRYKNGLHYSVKDINIFKGINKSVNYNYAVYHRASNLFVEKYNSEKMYMLTNGKKINQFQIIEPIIAGEFFFKYALHYNELFIRVNDIIKDQKEKNYFFIPEKNNGDKYIKRLFINALMAFIDRFNEQALTDSRFKLIYKWSYSLRLNLINVYEESINKYALGNSSINNDWNLFSLISEMSTPEELDILILYSGKYINNNGKYPDIYIDDKWRCDSNE